MPDDIADPWRHHKHLHVLAELATDIFISCVVICFPSMKYIDKCLTVNTEVNALEIPLKWLPHHCAVMH